MIIAKKVIDGMTLNFHWADETVTSFKPEDFSQEIRDRAMMAGFGHKLGDAYSGSKGDVRTAQMMQLEVATALKEGDWNRSGSSSGGLVVEALARASGASLDEALAAWNGYDEAKQKVVAKDPAVMLARKEIELERAKAKVVESDEKFTL